DYLALVPIASAFGVFFFFLLPPLSSTLFPYTTLFRSNNSPSVGVGDPTKSELVRATLRGVRRTLGVKQRQGALVTVRRSKTDQEGRGREIAVPFGRTRHCPIAALKHWLGVAGIETGAIFPSMDKHG